MPWLWEASRRLRNPSFAAASIAQVHRAEIKTPTVAAAGTRAQATLVSFQTIRTFLDAQEVAPATGKTGIDAAKTSVVRVICVRK